MTYFTLNYRSKPHHDGCIMTGCDADAIAEWTVSEHLFLKITAWLVQRASIFYVTSFWASKLFRTSGFLVLNVQFFPNFHHCKRHLKKHTVGFNPLPQGTLCTLMKMTTIMDDPYRRNSLNIESLLKRIPGKREALGHVTRVSIAVSLVEPQVDPTDEETRAKHNRVRSIHTPDHSN